MSRLENRLKLRKSLKMPAITVYKYDKEWVIRTKKIKRR